MRIRELCVALATILAVFSGSVIEAWDSGWRVDIEPQGVSAAAASDDLPSGSEVYFTGQQVAFELTLFPFVDREVPSHWWEHLHLEIRDRHSGDVTIIQPNDELVDSRRRRESFRAISRDEPIRVSSDDRDAVTLTLHDLAVGDYDVSVVLRKADGVTRESARTISIREGTENLAIRKTWLIYKMRGRPFEEAKPYLLELAMMMNPDQWGYWKQLADMSIAKVPDDETLDYYVRAEQAIRERMRKEGETAFLVRSLGQVTLYRRVLPILKQHQGRLQVVVRGNPTGARQEYYWWDLQRNEMLDRIDLHSPRFEGFARRPAN